MDLREFNAIYIFKIEILYIQSKKESITSTSNTIESLPAAFRNRSSEARSKASSSLDAKPYFDYIE